MGHPITIHHLHQLVLHKCSDILFLMKMRMLGSKASSKLDGLGFESMVFIDPLGWNIGLWVELSLVVDCSTLLKDANMFLLNLVDVSGWSWNLGYVYGNLVIQFRSGT